MRDNVRTEYKKLVERRTPDSNLPRDVWRAAWVGGSICAASEAYILALIAFAGMDRQSAGAVCSVTLVFITAALTALGIFDRIGRYAGGGTIVPITGFANSIASAAMEYRSEGMVLGVGARMFQIAGPVLVYGIGSSVLAGALYYIAGLARGM